MSSCADSRTDRGTKAAAGRGAWGLAAAGLSLIAVSYGLARFSYGLFVPTFREQFALSGTVTGAIASGSYTAYCVAIVLAMLLTPRWGGRRVAIAAGLVATAGTLAIALAPSTAVLAAGVIIAGASTGVASPPLAHAVTRAVPGPAGTGSRRSSTPAPEWASRSPARSRCSRTSTGGSPGSPSPRCARW